MLPKPPPISGAITWMLLSGTPKRSESSDRRPKGRWVPAQIVSRSEALARSPRVTFDTPELVGSIALKGGRLMFDGLPADIDERRFKEIYGEDAVEVEIR